MLNVLTNIAVFILCGLLAIIAIGVVTFIGIFLYSLVMACIEYKNLKKNQRKPKQDYWEDDEI